MADLSADQPPSPPAGPAPADPLPVPPPPPAKAAAVDAATHLAAMEEAGKVPAWLAKARFARSEMQTSKARGTEKPFLNKPTPGYPPPPANVLGAEDLLMRHVYQWDPNNVMAAHFHPDRHTVIINGRPMQVCIPFFTLYMFFH